MATETQEPTSDKLIEGLSGMQDFSGFKMGDTGIGSEEAVSPSTLKEEPAHQPARETVNRGNTEETAKTSSQEPEAKAPQTDTTEAASKRTDTPQAKGKSAQDRIREVVGEKNELKAKYDELEKRFNALSQGKKVDEPEKPKERPHLIPPPEKPKFTRQQLKDYIAKAKEAGRDDMVEVAQEELEKIRDYEIELAKWEFKDSKEWERHQSHEQHYTQEAIKRWPELNNPESEQYKEYTRLMGRINQIEPAFLKKPESRYVLGEVMEWRLKSGRLDAAEEKIKKLEAENQRLTKAQQPITTSEAPVIGSTNEKADAPSISSLAQALKQVRR